MVMFDLSRPMSVKGGGNGDTTATWRYVVGPEFLKPAADPFGSDLLGLLTKENFKIYLVRVCIAKQTPRGFFLSSFLNFPHNTITSGGGPSS
jgi:hypothetical protein